MDHPPTLTLFAGELRRARATAGLTQEALSQQINYSPSLVAMVEQCHRLPSADFTERCDEALGTDGLLGRIRVAITHEAVLPWFREWVAIEQEAIALRSFQPLVVPGLLQTEGYARALFEAGGPFARDELERQVAARLARQAVLDRENPPQLVAVLDEQALCRPVGGPAVMREQLGHLAELGRRPLVQLHLIPANVGAYAGLSGPFVLATPAEGDDVGYVDTQLQGHIVHRSADVRLLQRMWESVRAEALPHRQTLDMIAKAAQTWT